MENYLTKIIKTWWFSHIFKNRGFENPLSGTIVGAVERDEKVKEQKSSSFCLGTLSSGGEK